MDWDRSFEVVQAQMVSDLSFRLETMRKTLAPFAKEADAWEGYVDDEPLVDGWPGGPDSNLTVKDLREARRVYNLLGGKHETV